MTDRLPRATRREGAAPNSASPAPPPRRSCAAVPDCPRSRGTEESMSVATTSRLPRRRGRSRRTGAGVSRVRSRLGGRGGFRDKTPPASAPFRLRLSRNLGGVMSSLVITTRRGVPVHATSFATGSAVAPIRLSTQALSARSGRRRPVATWSPENSQPGATRPTCSCDARKPVRTFEQAAEAYRTSRVDIGDQPRSNMRSHLIRLNKTFADRDPAMITPPTCRNGSPRTWISSRRRCLGIWRRCGSCSTTPGRPEPGP